MGVEPQLLRLPSAAPVERSIVALQRQVGGRAVVASIDMLEGLKGVPLKLLAFEHFLLSRPERAKRVVLMLRGIVPDARPDDYQACVREVTALVERINARFAGAVIFEERAEVALAERLALWAITSVLLVTSVREGLNLLPFEYVLSREASPRRPSRST